MKNVIEGSSDTQHSSIFVETLLDGIDVRGWCVIEGDYKYVCYNMFKNKEQLFNLKSDRGEKKNLSGKPDFAGIRQKMRNLMLKYAMQTNDAVLIKNIKGL